jgi:hypothetical protein
VDQYENETALQNEPRLTKKMVLLQIKQKSVQGPSVQKYVNYSSNKKYHEYQPFRIITRTDPRAAGDFGDLATDSAS